ncbi:MAG: GIY-YIG nuclease family protein [Accumulibacter sp.]|uniref:GIY-YIG domain-containing protein n=1 Tax=Accumulibacter sp. TaxID=2053492 RepID=UPI0033162CD7
MPWSTWKLLGEGYGYLPVHYEGAVCYELAIRCKTEARVVYVGKATHANQRLNAHARGGSHLRKRVLLRHRNGWSIYYRFHKHKNADAARAMEERLLETYRYPWNKKGLDRRHRLPLPIPDIRA